MTHYLEPIRRALSHWPAVQSAPHRFDAVAFHLHLGARAVEIGHVHSGRLLDIPFTKRLRDALLAEDQARAHRFAPHSGWVSFSLRAEADVAHALWLLRLSYLHKLAKGRAALPALDWPTEWAALQLSPAVAAAAE